MGDAVEHICILVEHQLVAFVENGQEPPARLQPSPGPAPIKLNAFGSVGMPTPGPVRAGLL